ncbi:MAG: nucleoside-diphosphate sugar epimerase/dehydratase [Clostridia bacterium]|nr:nucleoside-diphosphate sugar epimerase/dehydratase [Clostridia bacterium]
MTHKKSNPRIWRHRAHVTLQVLLDILLVNLSFLAALYLRYEKIVPVQVMARYSNIWPVFTFFCLAGLAVTKTYKCLWRYASIGEVLRLLCGTLVGVGATYAFAIMITTIQRANTQIPFMDYMLRLIGNSVRISPNNYLHGKVIYGITWLVMFILITGQRFSIRLVNQAGVRRRAIKRDQTRRVVIIGAGWGGASVIRELAARGYREGMPVAVIDDDLEKAGTRIMGIPIEPGIDNIPEYVKTYKASDIVIAIPSANNASMRQIMQICAGTGCKLRMVTAMQDVTGGHGKVSPMRDVNITDLLCREEVHLDMESIQSYLTGKVVLVTGGGGSIGSELCRQIAQFTPSHLVVMDIYENNAYELERELVDKYEGKLKLTVLIGSVRDVGRLDQVMEDIKPEVVFHAAAHKHVPLMENSPAEAVKNNIFGTLNVAMAADRHGVSRMVILSTDKAVNPTNVMGATKRVTELVIQYMARKSKTRFMAVRFGNVLGSNGSVIPLFKNQIARGGPVTVTHPEITRFFMTIPEAAQLVLQAGAIGQSGNIFVLDMGTPVKIVDLARNLIRLAGFEPDGDIKIDFCGLRPGEKLYEELTMTEEAESLRTTCHDKIMVLEPVAMDDEAFLKRLEALRAEASKERGDVRDLLRALVPTFVQGEDRRAG